MLNLVILTCFVIPNTLCVINFVILSDSEVSIKSKYRFFAFLQKAQNDKTAWQKPSRAQAQSTSKRRATKGKPRKQGLLVILICVAKWSIHKFKVQIYIFKVWIFATLKMKKSLSYWARAKYPFIKLGFMINKNQTNTFCKKCLNFKTHSLNSQNFKNNAEFKS